MVDPVLIGAGGGFAYGGLLIHKYGPARTIPHAIIGNESTGKSTLRASLEMDVYPVYQTRVATTEIGIKYRTKVSTGDPHVKDPWFKGRDYPHQAKYVAPQLFEFKPRWIAWIMDVETWQDEYNWKILNALSKTLVSAKYRHKVNPLFRIYFWTPRQGWTAKPFFGRDCKLITIILNKVDLWQDLEKKERARKCRQVIDYYMSDIENSPMQMLRNEYPIHFIAASIEQSYYYPHNNLEGDPQPFKKYIDEVIRLV